MDQPRRFPQIDERLFLQSVARALDVIESFAASPRPKSLGEIAEAAGINKSAAQRIGQTLLSRGYLEQTENGRLKLGRQFLDRSFDYLLERADRAIHAGAAGPAQGGRRAGRPLALRRRAR